MSKLNADGANLQGPMDVTLAAAVVLDGLNRIIGWSPAAEALLGYPAREVAGRSFATLTTHGLLPRNDGTAPDALSVVHRDGSVLRLAASVCSLAHEGVEQPARILVLAGLAEVRDWEARQAMLHSLVSHSPVGLNIYDSELRVVWANAQVGQELGGPVGQYQDLDADELYPQGEVLSPQHPPSLVEVLRQVLATGEPVIDLHYRAHLPAEPERECVWSCSYYRLQDADGRALGVCEESVDITDTYLAEQRLVLLNEAGSRIDSTLDVRRTAQELADIAVPRLSDRADVGLLETVLSGEEPRPFTGREALHRVTSRPPVEGSTEAAQETDIYPASSPPVRSMITGQSFVYGTQKEAPYEAQDADPSGTQGAAVAAWPGDDRTWAAAFRAQGFRSVMGVPLRARGGVLGVAVFFRQRAEPFTHDDRLLAEELGARAAVCLDNARRFERERDAALTLQRSLLPRSLPPQTAVELAYRYLPADSRVGVGGDWFDVIPLSGARVGLVVGDVVGHGLGAAATMGRLRTTVRALAGLDLAPDELLARLDDLVGQTTREPADDGPAEPEGEDEAVRGATCLYAVYDPVSGLCSMASAGHLPPAVVDSVSGAVSYPRLETGPPLGVGGMPFERTELRLPERSLVALFTDGLVRAAGRDVDSELDRLGAVLSNHVRPLEELCDSAVATMLPGPALDDVAVLIARTWRLDAERVVEWELASDPVAVSHARKMTTAQLADWDLEHLSFITELVVSELVTNAIRYAAGPIHLRLIRDRTLICEVSDSGHTSPHMRRAASDDEGGRGLFLVAQMTQKWGTRYTSTGKTIWAEQHLVPTALNG